MPRSHKSKADIEARKARLLARLAKLEGKPLPGPESPDPAPETPSLQGFLAAVRHERDSFDTRCRPDETVCLDIGGAPYTWPEGDAATIARQYALDIAEGKIIAGELIRLAAKRFLDDLANGCQRGIFWDPVAARNAVKFVETFCNLKLMPWQTWVLASAFAFKRATGFRRFAEVWLSIGRKNGKTTFASAIGLLLQIGDLEPRAMVFSAATAKDVSKICWLDARHTVTNSPELLDVVKRFAADLDFEATDSHFQPLASEEKSFLGTRPHGIICDEVGVWDDRAQFDVLSQGTVSRKQPMLVAITTAPENRRCFCWEKFVWVERILRRTIEADSVFAAIYTLDAADSGTDINALKKANPSLGVTMFEEHLLKQIEELKETPSGLNNFLQFHANVTPEKSISQQSSISAESWAKCAHLELFGEQDTIKARDKFLKMNQGLYVWGGIDFGATDDMTAVAWIWRKGYLDFHKRDAKGNVSEWAAGHHKRFVVMDYFLPEERLLEKEKQWGVPLSTWVRNGFITLVPGDMMDQRELKKYLLQSKSVLCLWDVGFDPWQCRSMCAELTEAKLMNCVEVPQIPSVLTDPCRELLADIRRGELVHFGDPVLAWMAENVVMEPEEPHGGIRPQKAGGDKTRKIDGFQALVSAYQRMLAAPPEVRTKVFTI